MTFRRCSKCGKSKPATLEFFHKRSDRPSGLQSPCKVCKADWAEANSDSIKAYYKEYKSTHVEQERTRAAIRYKQHKVKIYERVKAHRITNAEAHKQRTQDYYKKNRERVLAANKNWKDNNPALRKLHKANRNAALLHATPLWADDEIMELIYAEADYRGMEVDHIVPLQGKFVCGLHIYYNTQLLSRSENSIKHNIWPYEPKVAL